MDGQTNYASHILNNPTPTGDTPISPPLSDAT